jgi:hypothetical protein
MPPDAFELLTVVRRYLVDEAGLPEAERRPRRERAIEAVSRAMGDSYAAGANANAPRQAAAR